MREVPHMKPPASCSVLECPVIVVVNPHTAAHLKIGAVVQLSQGQLLLHQD